MLARCLLYLPSATSTGLTYVQRDYLVLCSGNASEKPKVKVEIGGDHGTLAVAQPPAKRSKKGKKKHQGQASAADYLKVTPLSREADLLREVWQKQAGM